MPDQTAMLLTQEEWDDLEAMVAHYRTCTHWVEHREAQARGLTPEIARITQRRDLAERIIEANS